MLVIEQAKRNAMPLAVGAVLGQSLVFLCTGIAQWIWSPPGSGGFFLFACACFTAWLGNHLGRLLQPGEQE